MNGDLLKWLLGIFAALTVVFSGWAASSLAELPVIRQRLTVIESRMSEMEKFRIEGARFTAEDGKQLVEIVGGHESRLDALERRVETRMKGGGG